MTTTARTSDNAPPTKARLVAQAEEQNGAAPQYAGHWDGPEWVVMRALRDERTKLGLAVAAGDVVLTKRGAAIGSGIRWLTVYSWRNEVSTSLPATAFAAV